MPPSMRSLMIPLLVHGTTAPMTGCATQTCPTLAGSQFFPPAPPPPLRTARCVRHAQRDRVWTVQHLSRFDLANYGHACCTECCYEAYPPPPPLLPPSPPLSPPSHPPSPPPPSAATALAASLASATFAAAIVSTTTTASTAAAALAATAFSTTSNTTAAFATTTRTATADTAAAYTTTFKATTVATASRGAASSGAAHTTTASPPRLHSHRLGEPRSPASLRGSGIGGWPFVIFMAPAVCTLLPRRVGRIAAIERRVTQDQRRRRTIRVELQKSKDVEKKEEEPVSPPG